MVYLLSLLFYVQTIAINTLYWLDLLYKGAYFSVCFVPFFLPIQTLLRAELSTLVGALGKEWQFCVCIFTGWLGLAFT